jgi:SPP1 family predicted phage head-tail adaptor
MAFPKFKWVEQKPGLENRLYKFDKYVVVQRRVKTTRDTIGGLPYTYEDYLTGSDGYGIAAYFQDPTAEDMLKAAQHQENTTVTILVRYDARIKKSMRLQYWEGGEYVYYNIKVVANDQYKGIYTRIQAEIETEEAA